MKKWMKLSDTISTSDFKGDEKNIRRYLPGSTGRMRGPPSVTPLTIFGHNLSVKGMPFYPPLDLVTVHRIFTGGVRPVVRGTLPSDRRPKYARINSPPVERSLRGEDDVPPPTASQEECNGPRDEIGWSCGDSP